MIFFCIYPCVLRRCCFLKIEYRELEGGSRAYFHCLASSGVLLPFLDSVKISRIRDSATLDYIFCSLRNHTIEEVISFLLTSTGSLNLVSSVLCLQKLNVDHFFYKIMCLKTFPWPLPAIPGFKDFWPEAASLSVQNNQAGLRLLAALGAQISLSDGGLTISLSEFG